MPQAKSKINVLSLKRLERLFTALFEGYLRGKAEPKSTAQDGDAKKLPSGQSRRNKAAHATRKGGRAIGHATARAPKKATAPRKRAAQV